MPSRRLVLVAVLAAAGVLAGVPLPDTPAEPVAATGAPEPPVVAPSPEVTASPTPDPVADDETLRLAFAGDVHFEGAFSGVPAAADTTLGPMSDVLRAADLAMVNLESAVTTRGEPAAKELEVASNRFWFRTPPSALDVLARSGVDVVSVANNHGADYGAVGVADTVAAGETGAVPIVGAGRTDRQAFAPHRVRVKGTDVAVHAADASPLESADPTWAAAPGTGPGLASARGDGAAVLAEAVRASAAKDDLVIVYLHWGEEYNACPVESQESLAAKLAAAGADVVVGAHAHTPSGAGLLGDTYVGYGLGNFYWYHGRASESGVLLLSFRDGKIVGDEWRPGAIPPEGGGPVQLGGSAATAAVRAWHELRGCTGLAAGPGPDAAAADPPPDGVAPELPGFTSSIEPVGPSVSLAMRNHDPVACPVPLTDLRYVTVTHVGFDGRARRGELVVHADVAAGVVDVFAELYAARFPIERMLLVDEYGGDDDRSMAANNTSAYNCRRVAGQTTWSNHAYGRAIDINPVQNPYVVGGDVRPAAALPYLDVDRGAGAPPVPGVIQDGGVVREAFERAGWEWGGLFSDPDYQHFSIS
ncbi:CapA family protein [Jiangella alba]|uniref:CapA family protein n=1 Tax=Jiangella alba TaxID=561176 RepID=UPI001C0AE3A0|nr:CapA family protein [Jiangella alba]